MIDQNKNQYVNRIFLMVLLAIIADQSLQAVLLEAIAPISIPYVSITNTFLLSSMPFALLLATWSDFHCRRKTIIFTLISLSISGIIICFYKESSSNWIAYTSLMFKAIGGNVTPVALASLATVVPPKKFTISLAIAICAYSIGILVPIYLRSFHLLPLAVTVLSLFCTIIIIKWFKETEFDNFKFKNNSASFKKFFGFLRKDVVLILFFVITVPILLAYFGFIASEVSFYQILLRGEVLEQNSFYSSVALKIGIGYYGGTLLLYILLKKNLSDTRCLGLGVFISLVSIFTSSILSYNNVDSKLVYNILILFFSSGFALLTPCLFSILSKIRNKDEQGKIYGLLDTTDTLSAYAATKYIGISKTASYNQVLWLSSTLFFISAVFILSFIRDIKERMDRNRDKIQR